jgi:hypothetical protein
MELSGKHPSESRRMEGQYDQADLQGSGVSGTKRVQPAVISLARSRGSGVVS